MADDTNTAAQTTTEAATGGKPGEEATSETVLGGGAANADEQKGADTEKGEAGGDTGTADEEVTSSESGDDKGAEGDKADSEQKGEGDDDGETSGDDAPFDPEKLELPEGFTLDEKVSDKLKEIAEARNLNHAAVQDLVGMHAEAIDSFQNQMQEAFSKQVEDWGKAAQSDKEIGGDNWKATIASADRVMKQYATPELRQALEETGLGNHPELIRFVSRIGKEALSEDSFDTADPATGQRTPADVLYPNMAKK